MSEKLVAGIDEVARGCLAGPVYAAAVIWPNDFDENEEQIELKDSKKLSRKKRDYLKDYIEEMAIDYSVASVSNEVIDKINILQATFRAMHNAIHNLNVVPEELLVDGKIFEPYFTDTNELIPHKCIIGGDDKYQNISAASILAKVYHDNYIDNLLEEEPDLKVYNWQSNMCYGTAEHINAIKEYGTSNYHRKTFGICKIF